MGMKKKADWIGYGKGLLLTLTVYLFWLMLLAFVLVRGICPEGKCLILVAAGCVLAPFLGGGYTARHSSWGRFAGGSLVGLSFAISLLCVGLLCWERIEWTGSGALLLFCALGGGLLAGMRSGGKGKRSKRRRNRT